eukprot:TRINITY_DN29287_c0_g1_i1.p1 TRINITY_DN29287_c0_g1~~TRINITY_DN29287_c0_g1_i1.p1  ORF type:complete len:590 (-),score=29.73 TRINITY_DN29287_c0_g1_i1:234-2003(-)
MCRMAFTHGFVTVWAFTHVVTVALGENISACSTEAVVGRCLGVGCFMDHGPAVCKGTDCMCATGHCSYDGYHCVPTPTTTTTTTVSTTTTTTSTMLMPIAVSPIHLKKSDECVSSATVGYCLFVGCFLGHGAASCGGPWHMQCICDEGYCSRDGWFCEPSAATHAVRNKSTSTQTYVDLGAGKCVANGRKPAFKYFGSEDGGNNCAELCSTRGACHGYSKSIYGGCLLWMESGLSGGGDQWGFAHCHVKAADHDSDAAISNTQTYVDLGVGKCLVNGRDPSFKYFGSENRGEDCELLCTRSSECHGYSRSVDGGCLLWTEPSLSGGGAQWGSAHCQVKSSGKFNAPEVAPPYRYSDLGVGKCTKDGRAPTFQFHGSSNGGADCEALCTMKSECRGFSESEYGNCILWTESGLSGGGASWGSAHCRVKQDDQEGSSKTASIQAYIDLGAGKCLANGKDPIHKLVDSKGRDKDCQQLCTESPTCFGFSQSESGSCLLWMQSGLSGGGDQWGLARCQVKVSGQALSSWLRGGAASSFSEVSPSPAGLRMLLYLAASGLLVAFMTRALVKRQNSALTARLLRTDHDIHVHRES